jgi:hypothetical protein
VGVSLAARPLSLLGFYFFSFRWRVVQLFICNHATSPIIIFPWMQQYEHKWFVENSIRIKFDLTRENWFNNRLLSFSFLWLNLNPILIALENKEDYSAWLCGWTCVWTCVWSNFKFFYFLLKLSVVCTFWIVLMCWCQKWFLKNEKTSLACISAWKAI